MKPELICPAGNLPSLKAAVDAGADGVYLGLPDATNARNFPGLNFDPETLPAGISYAHARGRKVFMAINTYAQAGGEAKWRYAVDTAAHAGVDAVILADPGIMAYAAEHHPQLRLHLSVQGSATNAAAIDLYRRSFGIARAVLPRVLSIAQVEDVIRDTEVEIEVFGFGSLCVMVEGRCALSAYATGEAPNTHGVCSPASAVRWSDRPDGGMDARLNDVLIDSFEKDERAGYPTLCKGRFEVDGDTYYAIEDPVSLNAMALLPDLMRIGVAAIKIEGRQRSPAYVGSVTRAWRAAVDDCAAGPEDFKPRREWTDALSSVAEAQQVTFGAYHREWR
ncbi:MAG TPA: peptidase U32 family protein [Burkholderiales bacterium]|nr:peptidase U32 family protein [Burkholderiales bacterium]